jgi:hypothetical protein
MRACAVRARVAADVLRAGSHPEPIGCKRVLDVESECERVAGLWMEGVLEHDPVRLTFGEVPSSPADQPVDRVAVLGLSQGQLVPPPSNSYTPWRSRFGQGRSSCPRPDVHIASTA